MRVTAQSPLHERIQRAGAALPAGGFVLAESEKGETRITVAGQPAPRADVPPEKILFEIGSITKLFTGLLLAQAVLDGKAALADPIAKHLPADLKLDPHVAAITLEQLSLHTSGLPRLPTNFAPANRSDPYADYSAARLIEFLQAFRPAVPPPQPVAYSNIGVGLLGHLLERIYGQTYADLLAAKITRPLGLTDTVLELSAEQQTRFATPHSGSVRVLPWKLAALAGAGAIRSTGADLLKFGRALLTPTSSIHAAWELARTPRGSGKAGLGMGITQRPDGKSLYTHSGGTGGFRSYFGIVPDDERVVALLLNNDSPEPHTLVAPAPAGSAVAAAQPAEQPIDAAKLAEYVGVYQINGPRKFTVIVDPEGRLRIRLTGQPFGPMLFAGNDRFFHRQVRAEFQFARAGDGSITAVTLHQNGNEMRAKRTAEAVPTVLFLGEDKLRDYVGSYTLAPMTVFDVTTRAGHLVAKLTGQQALPVFCDRKDHFVYDVVEAALTFERDADGAVTALVLHQNGIDQRAPRNKPAAPSGN